MRLPRTRTVLLAALAAALLTPTAASAAVSISWSQSALKATADGSGTSVILGLHELELNDGSRQQFPSFNVTGPVTYDTNHCLESFGFIVCDWADRTQLVGGSGTDSFTIWDDFPAEVPVELFGNGGNDTLKDSFNGIGRTFEGGDGADKLIGYGGNDVLRGGPGNDEVDGHGGNDVVEGGEGDDTLYGDHYDAPGADVIDGGPGRDKIDDWDVVSGGERPAVNVTLDGAANDGRPGENDNLINVEQIEGPFGTIVGSDGAEKINLGESGQSSTVQGRGGDDEITTANGPDTIDAGAGNDAIIAGFGDDTVTGGPGRDTIYSDSTSSYCGYYSCTLPFGNDTVNAVDGEADSIDCGVGNDAANVDAIDVVSNCERVTVSGGGGGGGGGAGGGGAGGGAQGAKVLGKLTIAAVAARGLVIQVPCAGACSVSAQLVADKATARKLRLGASRRLAKGGKTLLSAGSAKLTLKVPAKAKARFKRLRKATLTLKVTVKGADGKRTALPARTVRLKS